MVKTVHVCKNCGHTTPSWMGRCPQCGEWNTFTEQSLSSPKKGQTSSKPRIQAVSLSDIAEKDLVTDCRIATGFTEIDRVLGGGVVEGSLTLLSGDPGIGKSTLLLELAAGIARSGARVLYVSSEESLNQLYIRIQRLEVNKRPNLYLLATDSYDDIIHAVDEISPRLVVVDSIQNVALEDLGFLPGSIALLRGLSVRFMEVAKRRNIAFFLVGHVTKEGVVAGPRTLEHLVDVVMYLEGEPQKPLRVLRGVKNRFGSTQEVGLLEMRESGLVELADPSQFFVTENPGGDSGTARTVLAEGKRALVIEIQSLVNPTSLEIPRRISLGIDFNRLQLLVAVLEKRSRVRFSRQDIYLNIVGGMRINETVTDLAVCFSLASSRLEKRMDPKSVYLGEVGLNGEIRAGYMFDSRISEAARSGATRVVLSDYHQKNHYSSFMPQIEIVGYKNLTEALLGEGIL